MAEPEPAPLVPEPAAAPEPRVPGPWPSRDPGVFSRPGASSLRQAALWDAVYELCIGTTAGITAAGAQGLIDQSIGAHEAKADPHPVYLTQAEGDLRYGGASGLSPHAHIDATTGGVIDYLRTQWGTDHLAAADPHGQYLNTARGDARYPLRADADPYPVYYNQARGDGRYLQVTGGALSGDLTLSGAAAQVAFSGGADLFPAMTLQRDRLSFGTGQAAPDVVLVRQGNNDLRVSAAFIPTSTNTRDLGTAATRWRKIFTVDADFTNAPVVGGSPLLTQSVGDARYLQPAAAASAYVPLAGGSVMTGGLGPTTTNVNDLGTTTLRWRKTWGVDADLSGGLNVGGAGVFGSTVTASNVVVGADTFASLLARIVTLEGQVATLNNQMGPGTNGHYHLMGTWRQTLKATLPATVLEEVPAA